MTAVRPFRALRYDPAKVKLSEVIVPPYDVIAHDERERFYERDPHNAIRLELTRNVADEAATEYAEVARTLSAWRGEGVLLHDVEPALYVMRQRFRGPDGTALERTGFFAELQLEDYARRVVLPHERTLSGPKADRLKQLRAARANLSSVFLLYEDRAEELGDLLARAFESAPVGAASDNAGVEYALARLDSREAVARVSEFLAPRPVVIADGHHRYETALAYRDEQRAKAQGEGSAAPYESTLAYFANAFGEGTLLLPIHRVILKGAVPTDEAWRARLPGWQERRISLSGASSGDAIPGLLAEHLAPLARQPAFVADDGGGELRLFWRDAPLGDALMVRIAEDEVIGGVFGLTPEAIREGAVSFPKSAERAAQEVRSGAGQVALYLNPMTPDDVFRMTGAGELMPQKSTFFFPKIPTGLVFRTHDSEEAGA